MRIEDQIKECELNLNQIKRFDPDPYYVNYFFHMFIKSVNNVYNGIFEEANNDFGLSIRKYNKETFRKKAEEKEDQKAIEFLNWFENKVAVEHKAPYPNLIKNVIEFADEFCELPKNKIMIRPKERYSDDKFLEIKVNLTNKKLRSREDLEIEIKRNMPIFLEIINHKRLLNNEPIVSSKETTASVFIENHSGDNFEISYASEIYIPVLKRLVKESRKKIKELTSWE